VTAFDFERLSDELAVIRQLIRVKALICPFQRFPLGQYNPCQVMFSFRIPAEST
jgi:hypothetical protein